MSIKSKSVVDKIKIFSKNFMKGFVIYGLLAFILLVVSSIIVNYNAIMARKCKDFESEYDVARDIVKIMYSSTHRGRMLQYVFSNENFLLDYMKNRELRYYEKIKVKLPKDDFLLDLIAYYIQKSPYIISDKHNKEFEDSLVKFLKKIKNKKSAIKRVNRKVKIGYITTIADHIAWGFYKNDNRTLNFLESYLLDLMDNSSVYNQTKKNYIDFLLTANLVSINKRQSLNSKNVLDNEICYDSMYKKWKNRVLKAYSYIDQKKIQYRKSEYIADRVHAVKGEKNELDRIENEYCKNIPKQIQS